MSTSSGSMGYTCQASIAGNPILLISDGLRRARTEIVSAGSFGATRNRAGGRYVYDYDRYQGDLGFDVNTNGWTLIKRILNFTQREDTFTTNVYYSSTGLWQYTGCLWTNFSIETSGGSLVTATIGVLSHNRNRYNEMEYIDDETIVGDAHDDPVAFWETEVSGFTGFEIEGWRLNVSNNVVELNTCQDVLVGDTAPGPINIKPSLAEVNFGITLWGKGSAGAPNSVVVTVGDLGTITLDALNATDEGKNYTAKNDPVRFTAAYNLHGDFPVAA